MTPLYDVISVWPYLGDVANQFRWRSAGLAMALRAKNAHYTFQSIRPGHWYALAMKNGRPTAWQARLAMIGQVDGALATVTHGCRGRFRSERGMPSTRECNPRCTGSMPVWSKSTATRLVAQNTPVLRKPTRLRRNDDSRES